jgi:hypothetical protein
MAGLPDPQRSQAVLIGVSDFEELLRLPAVEANVEDLAKVLAAPQLWRLPAENISIPRDLSRPFDVKMEVRKAAAKATDTLLVYYGGHGLLDDLGKIHLAIASSTEDAASGVPYTWIHAEVSASRALRKIIILDCCYAERALHQAATAELGPENFQMPNTSGMYLFFAATKNEKALVGRGRHTIFTGEFLKRLEDGIVSGPKMLSLQAIYNNMLDTFAEQEFPSPRLYGDLRSDGVVFGENPAWTPDAPAPGPDAEPRTPDGVITAESLERDLFAEQQAEMCARPGGSGAGTVAPQLGIKVLGADEIRGEFQVRVTGRIGMSVDVQLTRDVLDRALAARSAAHGAHGGHAGDEAETEPLVRPRRTQTPLLEVLAWALLNRLLPPAGPAVWSPHEIGNGHAPEADRLNNPGRRTDERRILPTEADRQVTGLIEEEQHVLLLGAGASGKTTIARSQARAGGDARGDGVIWLDLTDPDDGAESVLLTLLGLPEHERYLLVVDNLQAQAPVLRRHPVLDLIPRLTEEFGLPITALATAWPGIERVLDVDEYYLEPVMTQSLRVINQMVGPLPPRDRGDVLDLAEGDIEVALVALDFYREHHVVPNVQQVAEQLARGSGADQLTDPRQRRLLYWFACLGALEIDIPQRYVASWREHEDRLAVKELLRRELIEPNDEAWSVGNSTRARLLMLYALSHWDSASDFESRGRLVYDHLRRMGPRHIRNTLAQLRLKYDQGQRGELGDLWVQCLDLTRQLEVRSDGDPTWGGNSLAAAFVAIALGAMDSESTADVFATVAPGLDLLDPPAATPSIAHGSTIVPAVPNGPARPSPTASASPSWPAAESSSAADAELGRRLVLGVLITAEAAAGKPTGPRTRRFQKLVRQAAKPSGALGPADAPWLTAMIASGAIQLQRGRRYDNINDAVLWLSRSPAEGGAFKQGWSIGRAGRQWQDFGDPAHLDAFATAHCVKAIHDGSQTTRNRVLRQGLDILRDALPGLAEDGSEMARAAVIATLLHCGDDWHDLAQDLGDLLRWAVLAGQDEPEDGATGVIRVVWAASLLLSVVPPIVMRELEPIVDRLLDAEVEQEPPDAHGPAAGASPFVTGDSAEILDDPPAVYYESSERPRPTPAMPLEPEDEPESEPDADADAMKAALATERLEIVKEAAATMQQEIRDQIARRRSILRDMSDPDSFKTINDVLTEWQELKKAVDRAFRDLSITTIDDVVPRINELGLKIYRNSWQDIE